MIKIKTNGKQINYISALVRLKPPSYLVFEHDTFFQRSYQNFALAESAKVWEHTALESLSLESGQEYQL